MRNFNNLQPVCARSPLLIVIVTFGLSPCLIPSESALHKDCTGRWILYYSFVKPRVVVVEGCLGASIGQEVTHRRDQKKKATEDRLIEMQLTDLTQKSAGKAIIDHPTTSDRDHILISLDPCSASRNSSTPGSQYQACFGFSDDYTPVLSYWGIFTLAKRLKWCPTKLGR